MNWIKRNLGFVIGSVVALVLLGGAGWYFYSSWKANGEVLTKLHEQYGKLDELNKMNPHPGRPPGSDNIRLAKEQQQQLRDFKTQAVKTFTAISGIPEGPKVASEEFSTSLRSTIDRLQKAATNSSIGLPADYSFSFAAQRGQMRFGSNAPNILAMQLGEVKAICDVLFAAKVNAIEYIHRERVTPEDQGGTTDYLNQKSVTNELAVLTPYEVKFKCFTPELAATLGGFASSPHGLLVKSINVELAPAVEAGPETTAVTPAIPIYTPAPEQPQQPRMSKDMSDAFRRRYGLAPGRRSEGSGSPPPVVPQPAPAVAATAATSKGGLQTVLDERQLAVTLGLNVVKLLPSK